MESTNQSFALYLSIVGRQPRPQAPAESRQVATITAPGVPPPSEAPQAPPRRPLPRQPPPNRGRPRPIRPRPNRRPQKGFLDRVRDGVDKAACKAQTFVSGQMLNNEKFIRKQINCVLEKGECDETGAMVKRKNIFLTPILNIILSFVKQDDVNNHHNHFF